MKKAASKAADRKRNRGAVTPHCSGCGATTPTFAWHYHSHVAGGFCSVGCMQDALKKQRDDEKLRAEAQRFAEESGWDWSELTDAEVDLWLHRAAQRRTSAQPKGGDRE